MVCTNYRRILKVCTRNNLNFLYTRCAFEVRGLEFRTFFFIRLSKSRARWMLEVNFEFSSKGNPLLYYISDLPSHFKLAEEIDNYPQNTMEPQ